MKYIRSPNGFVIGAVVIGTSYGIFYLFTLHGPEQHGLLGIQVISLGSGLVAGTGVYAMIQLGRKPTSSEKMSPKVINEKKGEDNLFGFLNKDRSNSGETEKPNFKERVKGEYMPECAHSIDESIRERNEARMPATVEKMPSKGGKAAKDALLAIKGLLETVQDTDIETWKQAAVKIKNLEQSMADFEVHMEAMMIASSEIRTGLNELSLVVRDQVNEDVA